MKDCNGNCKSCCNGRKSHCCDCTECENFCKDKCSKCAKK